MSAASQWVCAHCLKPIAKKGAGFQGAWRAHKKASPECRGGGMLKPIRPQAPPK